MSVDLKSFIVDLNDNLHKLRDYGHQFSDKIFVYVENLLKQFQNQGRPLGQSNQEEMSAFELDINPEDHLREDQDYPP